MHAEDSLDFFLCFGADIRVFIYVTEAEPVYRRISCRAGAGCGRTSHGAGEGADVQLHMRYGKKPHIPVSGTGQTTEHNPGSRVRKPSLKVFNTGIAAVIHVSCIDTEGSGALPIRVQITQVKYPVVEFGFCIGSGREEEYMVVARITCKGLLVDTITEPGGFILSFLWHGRVHESLSDGYLFSRRIP